MTAGTEHAPTGGGFAERVRSALAWRWGSQAIGQVITWTATILVVRLLDPADTLSARFGRAPRCSS